MGVIASDISIVLSGGSSNADPNLALGGDPSGSPITGYLNNLFDNESEDNSTTGRTDYRCFYVFNDNDADTFYGVKVWVASQVEGGASIKLGIPLVSDTQIVTISGDYNGGSLTLAYQSSNMDLQGDGDLAAQLQAALNNVPGLSGVIVTTTSPVAHTTNLIVSFAPGRHQPTLSLVDNSLTGGSSIDVNIKKSVDGGPINTIASPISSSVTPPTGITFTSPTVENPVIVGNLLPLDGFPVWVQRNCPPGAVGVPNDGAVIRLTGKPFSSA